MTGFFQSKLCIVLLLQVTRREYRGQRSVDAFSNYIREQMSTKVQEFHTLSDLHVDVSTKSMDVIVDESLLIFVENSHEGRYTYIKALFLGIIQWL